MRIFTRGRDAAEYMQKLESMVIAMAVEIIDDYTFVTSEPSVLEEMLYQENGTPYLERESILSHLVKTGVVVRDEYLKG